MIGYSDPDEKIVDRLHHGKNVGMRAFNALYMHEPRDWTFREVAERFSVTGFYQLEGVGHKTFMWMDACLSTCGLKWKGQS